MLAKLPDLRRPMPPIELLGADGVVTDQPFLPGHDLADWAVATFIAEDGLLANPDHAHLIDAHIGMLWCALPNVRQMNRVVGQAETGVVRGGKWQKARQEQQLVEWFGEVPDFIITIHADYAAECSDASFCSLVEHELYHCGQKRDAFGAPKFGQDGRPSFDIRGHDVEEFVGVVRRYGADASGVRAMVDAAKAGPEVARVDIAHACGTCHLRVA